MQAIIMAAGKGSRLGELSYGKPKSFIEIKGRKLIEYNLKILETYGVDDVVIVTGYQCGLFEEMAGNRENIRLVYNPFYEMTNVLGSFYMGMDFLRDDFLYLHADTLCEPQIVERMFMTAADIVLPVDNRTCDDEAMKVRSEAGKIVQITKQMKNEQADGEFIGVALFRKNTLAAVRKKTKKLMEEKAFEAYFESAIQRLVDEEDFVIKAIPTDGAFWAEIDFKEDYERAVREIPESLTGIFG